MPKYSTDDIIKQARKTFKQVEIGSPSCLDDWHLFREKGKWSLRRMGVLEFSGESTEEVMMDIGMYRGDKLVIGVNNETAKR